MGVGDLLLLHAAATLFMVGLIWFVQVVHYPLFRRVGADRFSAYAAAHQNLTTAVVAVPMIVEALSAAALPFSGLAGAPLRLAWTGAALVALIWLSTALVQAPLHRRLAIAYDPAVVERLVRGNWLRTLAWTARGALALLLLRG